MSEDDKSLKETFNSAVEPEEKLNIRDQDNAGKEFTPPNDQSQPRLNAAPLGMSGIKTQGAAQSQPESKMTIEFTPDFDQDEPNIDLTLDNTLIDGKASNGIEFIIKQEDDPSSLGIDGGRISRLTLVQNGIPSAHFDKEWITEPNSPLEIQVIDEIKEKFNDTPEIQFKGFNDPDPDNDHDI